MKRGFNYFTVYDELGIDIDIYTIIENLNNFNDDNLKMLRDSIDIQLRDESSNNIISPETLEDEYKIKILKEFFNKFSWAELEDIKKKIM